MSPTTPGDFRARAEECERLAAEATSDTVRETLLYVAARWRILAAEDEATQPPPQQNGATRPFRE
jgi:hypothetical protein